MQDFSDKEEIARVLDFYGKEKSESALDNQIECLSIYLHELRKMQKIFKELNIFEADDTYYAKIMEVQTKLTWLETKKRLQEENGGGYECAKSLAKRNFYQIVYGKMFGWGVHLWNILWTTGITILGFSVVNLYIMQSILSNAKNGSLCISDTLVNISGNSILLNLNEPLKNVFCALELSIKAFFDVLSPDSAEITNIWLRGSYMIEHIVGVFIITIFVAMISRKFMRM